MLKIVPDHWSHRGAEAWQLLWKKSDYPDKRIVKQIFYSIDTQLCRQRQGTQSGNGSARYRNWQDPVEPLCTG